MLPFHTSFFVSCPHGFTILYSSIDAQSYSNPLSAERPQDLLYLSTFLYLNTPSDPILAPSIRPFLFNIMVLSCRFLARPI